MDMFCEKKSIPMIPLPMTPRSSLTYEDVVKELIHDVKQHQRDLHMVIWVFREELTKCVKDQRDLDSIFPHIFDIYDVTVALLGALEDVIEMSQEQSPPCVGSCFEGNFYHKNSINSRNFIQMKILHPQNWLRQPNSTSMTNMLRTLCLPNVRMHYKI